MPIPDRTLLELDDLFASALESVLDFFEAALDGFARVFEPVADAPVLPLTEPESDLDLTESSFDGGLA